MAATQQPFPRLDTPFVESNGLLSIPWYKLLVALWQNGGGGNVPTAQAVYFLINGSGGVDVFDSLNNTYIGTIFLVGQAGQPAVAEAPGASPYLFAALTSGHLAISGAKIELSRDAGATWFPVSLTGAAVPVLNGDAVRATWYGSTAPTVTWFPD